MDLRKNTRLEKTLPYAFYLPLAITYFLFMVITAILSLFFTLKLICKKSNPTEREIDGIDKHSLNLITLEHLTELNKARGDKQITFGQLMTIYSFLNLRTEFEPDDVFS